MIGEKKHFIRFSVLPRGFHAGYVKIKGMRGEPPKESEIMAAKAKKTAAAENAAAPTVTSNQTVLPGLGLDLDHDSQDGTENPRYRPGKRILGQKPRFATRDIFFGIHLKGYLFRFADRCVVFGCAFGNGTLFWAILFGRTVG